MFRFQSNDHAHGLRSIGCLECQNPNGLPDTLYFTLGKHNLPSRLAWSAKNDLSVPECMSNFKTPRISDKTCNPPWGTPVILPWRGWPSCRWAARPSSWRSCPARTSPPAASPTSGRTDSSCRSRSPPRRGWGFCRGMVKKVGPRLRELAPWPGGCHQGSQ